MTLALSAPASDPVTLRANRLLAQMTFEEKVGQLSQIAGFGPPGAADEKVRQGQAGSVLWVSGAKELNRLQKIAMTETRMKIPLIFGLDVVHGYHTTFPIPLALAATWDMGLIQRVQAVAAREARADGIHWTFAPMVDISHDARWGRMVEGAGEDPYLGSAVAVAQVKGFQGPKVGSPDHLLACAKHFAGYGFGEGGRDIDSVFLPESRLRNVVLPPFEAAKKAGVGSFMAAYMDLNDVPATGNRWLMQDVLRKEWGFTGFVVSDAFSVQGLEAHGFARDNKDAALRAFQAGINFDMASESYTKHLPTLLKERKIKVADVDNMVRPLLEAKIRLGLFESPYAPEGSSTTFPAHRQLAREAAQRAAVLLRNEGGLMPLDRTRYRRVAVVGPLGDSQADMIGSWAGQAADPDVVTIAQGLRNRLGDQVSVTAAPGVQLRKRFSSFFDNMAGPPPTPWTADQTKAEYDQALQIARDSDLVVLAMGELAKMSGEAASRTSLELPGGQLELMKAIVALGKPTVLVLINGRPLDITWANEHVPVILEAWHPGTEGGNAVADLLFGEVAPTGRLPFSWPRNVGQLPLAYNRNLTHQPESGPEFNSRYWDDLSTPLFPFGYGLSTTTFEYSDIKVASPTVRRGRSLTIQAVVKNTGTRPAIETAQLYLHQKAGSSSRPMRELKGFQSVPLAPGESRTITFKVGPDERRHWSEAARGWVEDTEEFDVWVGANCLAPLRASFRVVP